MKSKKKEGYSLAETRVIMNEAIEQSAVRLRRRLRDAWKKQRAHAEQRGRYGITV